MNTDLHSFLNLLHDLILEGGFTENIVGSDACLTTIHPFSPGYAPEGEKPEELNNSAKLVQSKPNGFKYLPSNL